MLERLKQTMTNISNNIESSFQKNKFYIYSSILGFFAILVFLELMNATPE